MQHLHVVRSRIAKLRQNDEADEAELAHIEGLAIAGYGCSDFVDEIVERVASRSSYEGERNEREFSRVLNYAGLVSTYRRY